jgi:hypothetical protein
MRGEGKPNVQDRQDVNDPGSASDRPTRAPTQDPEAVEYPPVYGRPIAVKSRSGAGNNVGGEDRGSQ